MAASHPSRRGLASVASCWARLLAAGVVLLVGGVTLVGPGPVHAQLDLFPTTTAAPGATTTTTLLLPLESLTPAPTAAPPGSPTPTLLPGPESGPAPTLLPSPEAAPRPALVLTPPPARTTRTTTFTTTPTPPRTPLPSTASRTPRPGAPAGAAEPVADEAQGGEAETGFQEALPFSPEDEEIRAAGLDVELGDGDSARQVGMLASVAGGLLALVLLGVVGWVQGQIRLI